MTALGHREKDTEKMTNDGIRAIFEPASVAVVGASQRPGSVGRAVFKNLLEGDFSGVLYPVNVKGGSVCGVAAYKNLAEIPGPVELTVIIVPAPLVAGVAREAGEKGAKGIIVISAGFREVGKSGMALEQELTAVCGEYGISLVGPNCLGAINTDAAFGLNASFARRPPLAGNIGFISQSGALCTAVLDYAARKNIGFSKFISVGNKADIDELALLKYLHDDPQTKVIMMYVEDLRHGFSFIETVREITGGNRHTPIIVVKSGRTAAGAAAVSSHTGSLAGSEAIYGAIFHQSGIYRAQTIGHLFDYAIAFATQPLPRSNRVAIITNAGGPGIIATDITMNVGLTLAKFAPETEEVLAAALPPTANIHNPVDVIGDAGVDRYKAAFEAVLRDENVDGVIFILTPQSMTDIYATAQIIPDLARRSGKPVLTSFMGEMDVRDAIDFLEQNRMPHYHFPEMAARAMGAMYKHAQWINRQHLVEIDISPNRARARELIKAALDSGKTYLGEVEGNEILAAYDFPLLPARLAATPEEAVEAVQEFGKSVFKIVSPQVVHKSDLGGVQIGIETAEEARAAFADIVRTVGKNAPEADIEGVYVQQMAPKGVEVILGINRYKTFGPLLMFGLGGIFVEIFKDVTFRLAPIRHNAARAMIRSTKAYPMLNGARGEEPCDTNELERCLTLLSALAVDNPEIAELDVNPLIVHPDGQGCSVADCRILLDLERMK